MHDGLWRMDGVGLMIRTKNVSGTLRVLLAESIGSFRSTQTFPPHSAVGSRQSVSSQSPPDIQCGLRFGIGVEKVMDWARVVGGRSEA